jgi:mRNA interferase HicA
MKRIDLLQHLRDQGCVPLREGGNHSLWVNPDNGLQTAVPRHREVDTHLAKKICKDLGVSKPTGAR